MMNSNPDDNGPTRRDEQNTAITNTESLDRKISSVSQLLVIGPSDVLCGRSKASFNHVGNRNFRTIVAGALDEYTEATSKWAKSMVAAKLVGVICREGGRFLKQKKGNAEEWYELSAQESKAKASHAIRDAISAKGKTKATKTGTSPPKSTPPSTAKRRKPEPPSKLEGPGPADIGAVSAQAPHFSLTSMAGPFAMGGPHPRFAGGSSIIVQDQIQHLRNQAFRPSGNLPPYLGGMTGIPPVPTRVHPQRLPGAAQRPPREQQESKQGSGSDNDDADGEFLSLIDSVLGPMQSPKRKGN